jgi:hypothetical protein
MKEIQGVSLVMSSQENTGYLLPRVLGGCATWSGAYGTLPKFSARTKNPPVSAGGKFAEAA